MEVIRNQEFVLLPASEIAKLLASDDMNIPNEETILNALLTWVRGKNAFESLQNLSCLKFILLE